MCGNPPPPTRFEPMADFDWEWLQQLGHAQVEELFALDFVRQACNALLIGPNGTGKTLICNNLVHPPPRRCALNP